MKMINAMKKLILIILILITQGCVVKRKLQSGINMVLDRTVVVPMAVTRFITEASSKIYSIDSLSDNSPVLIKTFDVKFYSTTDSFEFNFKDIKFNFLRDTVHYTNFKFPKWDLNKYSDTMKCMVNCSFASQKHSEIRCLTGKYIITKGVISNPKKYIFCAQ